jgi:ligand-binding sensor domain-containing protein
VIFIRNILLFAVLFLSILRATASVTVKEDRYARFKSYTVEQGLSDNHVLDILQDDKGFIWIGTTDGLNRYDGYRFVNYRNNPDDSTSISDNYIQSLAIDEDGLMWVGTKNGLNIFDSETGAFKLWGESDSTKGEVSNPYIRKILPDTAGIIWIETVDGILNKLNKRTGEVRFYPHHPVIQEYYSYHCLYKDSDGDIWVGNRGKGPYVFNPDTEKLRLIKSDYTRKDKKRDQEIACVFEDSKGRYWMGAIDGFWSFDKNTELFERVIGTTTFNIIEDRDGFLWIDAGRGIYRFDPENSSADLFLNSEDDPHSLVNNFVNVLYEDRAGNIWAGTDGGVSVYMKGTNYFKHIRHISGNENSLISNKISSVLEDRDGAIWFGTLKSGLNRWNPKTDKFTLFKNSATDKSTIASNRVSCLYEDSKGTIWVGLWQGVGFNRFNSSDNTFTKFAYSPNDRKRDWYSSFLEDSQGRFMTGIWGANGLHFFDREKESFDNYTFIPLHTPVEEQLKSISIDGEYLWTARRGGVIHRFNLNTNEFHAFTYNECHSEHIFNRKSQFEKKDFQYYVDLNSTYKTRGGKILFTTDKGMISLDSESMEFSDIIKGHEVYAIVEGETDGEYWIGYDSGLGYYNSGKGLVLIESFSNNKSSLFNKKIKTLNIDKGVLFIGSDEGITLYNTTLKKFDAFHDELGLIFKHEINSFLIDRDGCYWIGTDNNLLRVDERAGVASVDTVIKDRVVNCILFSKKNNRIYAGTDRGVRSITIDGLENENFDEVDDYAVYSLDEDSGGMLWAGTAKGLIKIVPATQKIEYHNRPTKERLTSHLISFLANDIENNIWAGTTNKGVNRIDSETLEVEHFFNEPEVLNGFWGEKASAFCQQKDGTIWIGGMGLNKFNPAKKTFTHYTTDNGLPDNTIYSIQEDSDGDLWIGTGRGLVLFNRSDNNFRSLKGEIGRIGLYYSGGAIKLSTGELLFAGEDGALIFNPDTIKIKGDEHPVHISGVKLFGNYLSDGINESESLTLNYDENFFTLEFSAFNYSDSDQSYLYRLNGVDKDWVNSNNSNSAKYTKISPGRYRFDVKLAGENSVATSYEIVITPPFWRTWWFITLMIIIVVFACFWIIRTVFRKQQSEQQQIILEQRLLRLQMNPHFIFNVLIAIQSFIYKKNIYESGLYLSKFAKLMRMFLQNSRMEWITLASEIEALNYYLSLQQLRNEESFEYEVNCKDIPGTDYISIPPMMAQPFVENAIEHGLSGGISEGKVEIEFAHMDNHLRIKVTDNGKGIDSSDKKNSNKNGHKSMAISIIKERLDIMGGKSSPYGLEIRDISKDSEDKTGTEVMIKIPFRDEF